MNAVEKVAWTELSVSVLALVVVLVLFPWMGQAALGGFGLLGLLGITPMFLRQRGKQVVRDERDAQIDQRSTLIGFCLGWVIMLLSLVAVTMWHIQLKRDVPTGLLIALIWIQIALCFAIKGAISLIQYRDDHRAA